jgi:hypothetical protein
LCVRGLDTVGDQLTPRAETVTSCDAPGPIALILEAEKIERGMINFLWVLILVSCAVQTGERRRQEADVFDRRLRHPQWS